MKIHEYQAAQIFERAGIPVVRGEVAKTLAEALRMARNIGYPVVLKAQVLAGGRGKAGGIQIVRREEELKEKFHQLKSLFIKGFPVEKIMVVQALEIRHEFYAGVTVDGAKDDVVLIVSDAGGVEIEQVAKDNPQAIKKFYLEGSRTLDRARWPNFIRGVFKDQALSEDATGIFQALVKTFFALDCSLAEINPLIIDGRGKLIAADAKILFDDNALFRQEGLLGLRDPAYEDPQEMQAKAGGLSFVKLNGDVGCMVNGAGLAMGTMDMIALCGGHPANFLDVGGSSSPEKVLTAFQIILENKNVKVILINIFGGITRCDDIAQGIVEAQKRLNFPVPLVVRLTGTNEEEARKILSGRGISTVASMKDAVEQAVRMAKT